MLHAPEIVVAAVSCVIIGMLFAAARQKRKDRQRPLPPVREPRDTQNPHL